MANVLLVDDEPDFVSATRELLTLHGHTVDTAERLDDARRILGHERPEVLLLDLMLPDGNGLELLEELRDSSVKRVVFITGHPGHQVADQEPERAVGLRTSRSRSTAASSCRL